MIIQPYTEYIDGLFSRVFNNSEFNFWTYCDYPEAEPHFVITDNYTLHGSTKAAHLSMLSASYVKFQSSPWKHWDLDDKQVQHVIQLLEGSNTDLRCILWNQVKFSWNWNTHPEFFLEHYPQKLLSYGYPLYTLAGGLLDKYFLNDNTFMKSYDSIPDYTRLLK